MKYFNTLKYLKPSQIVFRLFRHRNPKPKKRRIAVPHKAIFLLIESVHLSPVFLDRFNVEELKHNEVTLLHQKIPLDFANRNLSPLLFFNLQYFEYGIALAAEYRKSKDPIYYNSFKNIFRKYVASGIPLNPYVISMQIVNWIVALNCFEKNDEEIYDEIYYRYQYLLKNTERHLLANHYLENVKAIIICSYLFNDKRNYSRYIGILRNELREQILPDGMHYEESFMYAKIVLEDLLVLEKIIDADWLTSYIQKLRIACFSMESVLGRTPLFNDSGNNIAKPIESLIGTEPIDAVKSLPEAGYFLLESGNIKMLVDCGRIGPDYNPGHSHCDCLSFEAAINRTPIFVNSGTYQYQGDLRSQFRSAAFHNTFMINHHEQSENWGEHRVARRLKYLDVKVCSTNHFEGSFVNYLGEKQTRSISLTKNKIEIIDTGPVGSCVTSYLHLLPGYRVIEGRICGDNLPSFEIEPLNCEMAIKNSLYSEDFGKIEYNIKIEFSWRQDLQKHGYVIHLKEK